MEAHGIDALQFRASCLNGYGFRACGCMHEQKGRREIRAKQVLRQSEAGDAVGLLRLTTGRGAAATIA